jgi:hypothetical protein
MKILRRTIISLLLFFMVSQVNSGFAGITKQPYEKSMINCFFKKVYDFSFREADSMVVVMKHSEMDNITLSGVKADLSWWKLLSGDAIETNLRTCDSIIHESLTSSLNNKKKDISCLLNIIYYYSLKARLENYRGNTLKSLISFYKSISYIEDCIHSPVKDEKLNLILGLYFYFIDYIEKEFFLSRAMFLTFPKGDKNKGLRYLEECSVNNDEMIRTEANYFLMKIYTYTERDYLKAFLKVKILTQQHPNNLVYSVEQFKLLLKMKKDDEAQIFRRKLIVEIQMAKNINNSQKNHFISLLGEPSIDLVK